MTLDFALGNPLRSNCTASPPNSKPTLHVSDRGFGGLDNLPRFGVTYLRGPGDLFYLKYIA